MTKIHTSNWTCTVGIVHRQQDERDQRHAGHAVGLEPVGARTDRVAGVVTRAVGDDAGVAGVVFLDVEDDLHQVRTDVGDLGEDAAGDAQRRRAERLADGEADETGPGVVARNEQQNAQHQEQLDADEQHADAHARAQRDRVNRVGLAAQAGKRRARIGEGVDPDAEPRHAVAAGDADQREKQDDRQGQDDRLTGHRRQPTEIRGDDDRDEAPQDQDELALGDQVGLARLVDQLGDLQHAAVHGKVLQLLERHEAEQQPQRADDQSAQEQRVPVDAPEKCHRGQIRDDQGRFATSVTHGAGAVRAGRPAPRTAPEPLPRPTTS